MKKVIVLAIALGLLMTGCAGRHGGHGCKSTVNNWYKPDRTRWQTSVELVDCIKRGGGLICNGIILEDCMEQKAYIWVDGAENPRNLKK